MEIENQNLNFENSKNENTMEILFQEPQTNWRHFFEISQTFQKIIFKPDFLLFNDKKNKMNLYVETNKLLLYYILKEQTLQKQLINFDKLFDQNLDGNNLHIQLYGTFSLVTEWIKKLFFRGLKKKDLRQESKECIQFAFNFQIVYGFDFRKNAVVYNNVINFEQWMNFQKYVSFWDRFMPDNFIPVIMNHSFDKTPRMFYLLPKYKNHYFAKTIKQLDEFKLLNVFNMFMTDFMIRFMFGISFAKIWNYFNFSTSMHNDAKVVYPGIRFDLLQYAQDTQTSRFFNYSKQAFVDDYHQLKNTLSNLQELELLFFNTLIENKQDYYIEFLNRFRIKHCNIKTQQLISTYLPEIKKDFNKRYDIICNIPCNVTTFSSFLKELLDSIQSFT